MNPLRFPGAERLAPRAIAAARRTAVLKRRLAARGVQAIYANDNFGAWRSDFSRLVAACESANGPSRRLVELLRLSEDDITVLKPRHSAFFGTPLAVLLAQLRARRLVLTGVAADICVLFTANDAFVRGFELWVPADCVAAETVQARGTGVHGPGARGRYPADSVHAAARADLMRSDFPASSPPCPAGTEGAV